MAEPIDPGVDIGHVHLKVADIDRALAFYCDVLGFELQQRFGDEAAFVSAGGYHHHIGLNTWQSKGGSPRRPARTGLFHLAIRYPTRRALADGAAAPGRQRGRRSAAPPTTASARRSTCDDPDRNGIELYWDRPKEQWPRAGTGGEGGDVHAPPRPAEPARRAGLSPVGRPPGLSVPYLAGEGETA